MQCASHVMPMIDDVPGLLFPTLLVLSAFAPSCIVHFVDVYRSWLSSAILLVGGEI
jgi:hypothetical protein